jgi:hypothetical protein
VVVGPTRPQGRAAGRNRLGKMAQGVQVSREERIGKRREAGRYRAGGAAAVCTGRLARFGVHRRLRSQGLNSWR